jgi:hypothetical protein
MLAKPVHDLDDTGYFARWLPELHMNFVAIGSSQNLVLVI